MNAAERAELQERLVAANARLCVKQSAEQVLSAQRRADVEEMAAVVTPLLGTPLLLAAGYSPVSIDKLGLRSSLRCTLQQWFWFADRTSDYRALVITKKGKLLALDTRPEEWRRIPDPTVFSAAGCDYALHSMAMHKFQRLKEQLDG